MARVFNYLGQLALRRHAAEAHAVVFEPALNASDSKIARVNRCNAYKTLRIVPRCLFASYIACQRTGESMSSSAKCEYHLKQLRKVFARANDYAFLQMLWAADALQSGRHDTARLFLTFPKDAADPSILSKYGIHRWELESLLIQLFITPKNEIRPGPNLLLNCGTFDSLAMTTNRLRKLEDVEAGHYLQKQSIFTEMHRIAQRQFHWQRGYFNRPQFYRYAYVYGQGLCAEYFEKTYGLTIAQLILVGFSLFVVSQKKPWLSRAHRSPEIGLTAELVTKALPLLSLSLSEARKRSVAIMAEVNEQHGKPIPTAFLPSITRQYPMLSTDEEVEHLVAPIPELLLLRITTGLYYDVVSGGQPLLNDANDRFEQYCRDYISKLAPRFAVAGSYKYGRKGFQVDAPDVLIKDEGKLVVVAECKATKLTYLAQFAEDPFEAEKKQYDQIAKAVFQVWRFFSHIRRGIAAEELAEDACGMVIMLDSFLTMSGELNTQVMERATALASEDPDIINDDRRHIVFCPIYDLEVVLQVGNEDTFLGALKASREERFHGWGLREVHRDCDPERENAPQKDYPFELDDLLPWWKQTRHLGEGMKQAAVPKVSPPQAE